MANRADFYVRNNLMTADLNVCCKHQDGSESNNMTVLNKAEERIHLPSPEVSMVLASPPGLEMKTCPILVKSDVDLEILYSRTDSNWTIKIIPNELPPDVPTDVNVTLGEEEEPDG